MATISEMQTEIADDKARIGAAASALKDDVEARARRARETVDPRVYARQYPWIALGLVVGAGFALGRSGADRTAAASVVAGARKAGEAIGDGAASAKDAVIERFSGKDEPEPAVVAEAQPSGVRSKLMGAVSDLLQQGLDEILNDLRVNGRT